MKTFKHNKLLWILNIILYLILSGGNTYADNKANNFGEYGYLDQMPYPVGQCFNNIVRINDVSANYKINISYSIIKLTGKTKMSLHRCAVFSFNDAIVGAVQDYMGTNVITHWYIKPDGVHLYGENGIFTGAMQYALSNRKHKKTLYLHKGLDYFELSFYPHFI